MVNNLVEIFPQLCEEYIDILDNYGEPNESYKYLAIDTFQDNWDIEAEDFYKMFRSSFSKISNLLYQNSWSFIEKSAQFFPEETRSMFRNLYDDSLEISQRIKFFNQEAERLLPNIRRELNRGNINSQQDERTLSVYLSFRFPEKYILYKSNFYINFCEKLDLKPKKSGERFLHFQELANQIIQNGLLENSGLEKSYRSLYSKPNWDDSYLKIQNILYVVFKMNNNSSDTFISYLKDFDKKELEEYYNFLDKIIERFDLQSNDKRLVFNLRDKKFIVFTIGQRYILRIKNSKSSELTFSVISTNAIADNYSTFEGTPLAYWNVTNNLSNIIDNQESVFKAVENELDRTRVSSFLKYNKKELEQMAFDIDFRNEVLDKLEYQSKPNKQVNTIDLDNKFPLNQILFGAPGTGKTYSSKKIAVDIINGIKDRTREEINLEYEKLVDAKQIVFTTFHQSLSYEDFIEGIKPVIDENDDGLKNIIYEVKNGIFKEICLNAGKKESVIVANNFDDSWNNLIEKVKNEISKGNLLKIGAWEYGLSTKDSLKYSSVNSPSQYSFTITKQNILDTYQNRKARPSGAFQKDMIEIVEYMKANFNLSDYKENEKLESNIPYVLIIDEINRGNVSAIFGELITLLEEDKRKGNKEHIKALLPYSQELFSVPNNVYIIGTMNTADRSVEALDTALRRRFSFVEMQSNPEILANVDCGNIDLKYLLQTINKRIELLIDKDHQIGHSYFIGINNLENLKVVFRDKIIPLLEEYFYSDFGKIGLVLGGGFIYEEKYSVSFPKNFNYDYDFLENRKVYSYTKFSDWNENTFISIYEN